MNQLNKRDKNVERQFGDSFYDIILDENNRANINSDDQQYIEVNL